MHRKKKGSNFEYFRMMVTKATARARRLGIEHWPDFDEAQEEERQRAIEQEEAEEEAYEQEKERFAYLLEHD
jgi:hypothetical protein